MMSARLILAMVLAVSFLTIACDSSPTATPDAPADAPTATPAASGTTEVPRGSAIPPTKAPSPAPVKYLSNPIAPCVPAPGSSIDPCDPAWTGNGSSSASSVWLGEAGPFTILDFLQWFEEITSHIAVRATYLPGTVRCDADYNYRMADYLALETQWDRNGNPGLYCFADVRVNEYIYGSGPPILTIFIGAGSLDYQPMEGTEYLAGMMERIFIEGGRNIADSEIAAMPSGTTPLLNDFDYAAVSGNEAVLFIGPLTDVSVEAWMVIDTWNVVRKDDGTVVVQHPQIMWYDAEDLAIYPTLERTIPVFKQAAIAAQADRNAATGGRISATDGYPMLITDANDLAQYMTSVGAYARPEGPPQNTAATVSL